MTTSAILLSFHPAIQLCAVLLSLYVLWLGLKRFAALHFNIRVSFKWQRHVMLGSLVLIVLLGGASGGMTMVYLNWKGFLITGTHGRIAMAIVPLILFGLGSGIYMHRNRAKRKILPLLHGICNTLIVLLSLSQIYTGIMIYRMFVLGIY